MRNERLRWIHVDVTKDFSENYDLPHDKYMQDWPLEVSDRSLIDKFWKLYLSDAVTDVEKFICMQIICYGFEEYEDVSEIESCRIWPKIREALIRDSELLIWLFFDIANVDDREGVGEVAIHDLMRDIYYESLVDEYPIDSFIETDDMV